MMTLDEIRAANINASVAREAYTQAARRLEDTLETKKAYEQKTFTLFNAYITVALALFGVGGALFKDQGLSRLVVPFWSAGVFYLVGAVFFVLALLDQKYGALASSPDMWLTPGVIDGDDTSLPLMLAYVTYYHQERIETSARANFQKAYQIRTGIFLGITGPFVLLGALAAPRVFAYLQPLLN